MAKNFIIYQSRNRLTGTLTQTLDLRHKDNDGVKAPKNQRYAARCVEHKKVVFFDEHYFAGRAIAHVNEWCPKCKAMQAKGTKIVNKKAMVTGAASARTGRGDLRQSSKNSAYEKRWRNGPTTRTPKKETQRTKDIKNTATKNGPSAIVDAAEVLEP